LWWHSFLWGKPTARKWNLGDILCKRALSVYYGRRAIKKDERGPNKTDEKRREKCRVCPQVRSKSRCNLD
jgi:hypothetical protein